MPTQFIPRATIFVASILLIGGVAMGAAVTAFEKDCAALSRKSANEGKRLHKLFDRAWRYQMEEYPEWATAVGYPGQNHRWTDNSLEAHARRRRETQALAKAVASFDPKRLSPADRLNLELFKHEVDTRVSLARFPGELLALDQMGGTHVNAPQTLQWMSTERESDFEDRLKRLEALPVALEQMMALLREGAKRGITAPAVTLARVPDTLQSLVVGEKHPLLASFEKMPATIPAERQKAIETRAKSVLREKVLPAYERLRKFVTEEYIPKARKGIAWSELPDGKAWYDALVAMHTTTKLTAREVHEIGLAEVKRIRGEMEKVRSGSGHKGSFADFLKYLRTDDRFFHETPEALITEYRAIAKRIDPGLARLFGKLPRQTYGVVPVPSYSEKSQTTAYYEPGSNKAGRAGYFFANTYDLKARPRWEMEALTAHEAVPGHHLQIALAEEIEGVPEFRKYLGNTAYVEGWALYSEALGYELGLYEDPYSRFGQLVYEMWRAIRLVVDTGLHAMGWTREQAMALFAEHTPKTEHDIKVEVDRYIVMAGQALAYKTGQLKISALRKEAETALGQAFDIRAFHDAILEHGALPLDVLEAQMREWIKRRKARG